MSSKRSRPSVFSRLGTKGENNSSNRSSIGISSSSSSSCRPWADTGHCPYGLKCKFSSSHTLISPSKLREVESNRHHHHHHSNRKDNLKKGRQNSPIVDPDWENWDEKNLDYDDELMLEKKRQLLQKELAKQMEQDSNGPPNKKKKLFPNSNNPSSSTAPHGAPQSSSLNVVNPPSQVRRSTSTSSSSTSSSSDSDTSGSSSSSSSSDSSSETPVISKKKSATKPTKKIEKAKRRDSSSSSMDNERSTHRKKDGIKSSKKTSKGNKKSGSRQKGLDKAAIKAQKNAGISSAPKVSKKKRKNSTSPHRTLKTAAKRQRSESRPQEKSELPSHSNVISTPQGTGSNATPIFKKGSERDKFGFYCMPSNTVNKESTALRGLGGKVREPLNDRSPIFSDANKGRSRHKSISPSNRLSPKLGLGKSSKNKRPNSLDRRPNTPANRRSPPHNRPNQGRSRSPSFNGRRSTRRGQSPHSRGNVKHGFARNNRSVSPPLQVKKQRGRRPIEDPPQRSRFADRDFRDSDHRRGGSAGNDRSNGPQPKGFDKRSGSSRDRSAFRHQQDEPRGFGTSRGPNRDEKDDRWNNKPSSKSGGGFSRKILSGSNSVKIEKSRTGPTNGEDGGEDWGNNGTGFSRSVSRGRNGKEDFRRTSSPGKPCKEARQGFNRLRGSRDRSRSARSSSSSRRFLGDDNKGSVQASQDKIRTENKHNSRPKDFPSKTKKSFPEDRTIKPSGDEQDATEEEENFEAFSDCFESEEDLLNKTTKESKKNTILEGISDEDLTISDENDDNKVKAKIADALGVDWSQLVSSTSLKPPCEIARKQWRGSAILNRIGLSLKYLGKETFDQILNLAQENGDRVSILNPMPALHCQAAKKERTSLCSSLGPYSRALSSKTDIAMRKQMCEAVRPENDLDYPPESDLFREAVRLFEEIRPVC